MSANQQVTARGMIILFIVLVNILVLRGAYESGGGYWLLFITLPLLAIGIYNIKQRRHALLRNYPLIGYLRYWFESIRPEIRQYFFESDLDGKPFNRRQRSIVYQRSKNEKQTVAFGMQAEPAAAGIEWAAHSMYPVRLKQKDLRITVGNYQCRQPYDCSIFNIGAMSYGALSKTAIQSLNEGAKLGGFAHNTGEGGISDYHLLGGDLVWQIGTGYFGCRAKNGDFDDDAFASNASRPQVKMIELKISQGAKPGHGGILPAAKNTREISQIRGVMPGVTVYSPPAHTAFGNAVEMMKFIARLRELSGDKPVGFKLCIGDKAEFIDICAAIISTGIVPDFITIDGAEGGTGAAPLEFTDHLGMPMHDAVAFVSRSLEAYGIRKHIKVFAAGKIITGFDILKTMALGADACYSARGMMLALGCIQALQCDSGKCPVGIATQNPGSYGALDITDKRARVANFHTSTIKATIEIMEACGFESTIDIPASRFFRKIDAVKTMSFEEIYFRNTEPLFTNPARQLVLLN